MPSSALMDSTCSSGTYTPSYTPTQAISLPPHDLQLRQLTHTSQKMLIWESFSNAFRWSLKCVTRRTLLTFITSLLPASGHTLYILYMHQT
jgi:hypothetical protein